MYLIIDCSVIYCVSFLLHRQAYGFEKYEKMVMKFEQVRTGKVEFVPVVNYLAFRQESLPKSTKVTVR